MVGRETERFVSLSKMGFEHSFVGTQNVRVI